MDHSGELTALLADPETWEHIACCFHTHYEALAPEFGYDTRPDSAVPWSHVPEQNRRLMVATVGYSLRDLLDLIGKAQSSGRDTTSDPASPSTRGDEKDGCPVCALMEHCPTHNPRPDQ